MSFSYSSGVITQTGTDTNLSGLSGLTGVSTTNYQEHTIYELDYTLKITGNLTHNANEYLEFSATGTSQPILVDGGTYVVYGYITNEDLSVNLGRPQILALKTPLQSWNPAYGLRINANSSVIFNGAYIKINGALNTMASTSNFTANLGCYEGGTATDGNLSMLRSQTGGNIDVNGFIALNMTNALTQSTNLSLDDFSPRQNQEGLLITTGSNFLNYKTINNYNPVNCVKDVGYFGGSLYVVYGFPNVIPKCGAHINKTTPIGEGRFELRKIINFTIKDLLRSNISGAKIFMSDTNQPTTRDYSRSNYKSLITGNQILTVETYLQQTASDGTASIDKILAYNAMYASETVGTNSSPVENLYKTKASDHEYRDNAFIYKYGFLLAQIQDIDLTGLGEKNVESTLLPNTNITELDKATVDAYADIDTSAKFYDRSASYLEDNLGTYTDFIATRSGNQIDAGSYNVEVDSTAASVFDFNGSKITIKATEFIGDITTTGTITLLNGAKIIGSATDSGGTTTTLRYSIAGLVAGSNVRIYNVTDNSEVFVGIVAGTSLDGTYTEGVEISLGDTINVNTVNTNGTTAYYEETSTVIATSTGVNALVSQSLNTIYNDNNIDGSTVTGITLDVPNVEFDLDEADNTISSQEIYAWYMNELMATDGIRTIYKAINPKSQYRYCIDPSVVDLKFDNKDLVNSLTITDGYFYRLNNTSVIASGSGNIEMIPNESYVANSTEIINGINSISEIQEGLATRNNQSKMYEGIKRSAGLKPVKGDLPDS